MVSDAVCCPDALGVNATLMLQLVPAASEVPQAGVWVNSVALVPVIAMLAMLKVVLPTFVSVTFCGGLVLRTMTGPKLKLVGESFAIVPTPLTVTCCGLPLASSLMLNAAVSVPGDVGLKVTLMLQLAPAANEAPHV
jgi:hypothetical protein